MSMHIRLPNITGRTPEEQAQQMKSYLSQLAGELNWALANIQGVERTAAEQYRSSNQGGSASNPQQKAEDILKNFNDIKGLIIKSADIVNAYYEEINTRLEGLYVAQSDYGTFVEQTTSVLNQTSTGIKQNYTNIQMVAGRVFEAEIDIVDTKDLLGRDIANTKDDLDQNIANTKSDLQGDIDKVKTDLSDSISDTEDVLDKKISDTKGDLEKSISDAEDRLKELLESSTAVLVEVFAHINSGLLYYDENGIPVYGLEVGQRNLVNGQEVFNKYARFTASKLSFYDQNGTEVAYISDKKLYITHVEITSSLTQGGFVDTAMADKSIVTKWIGGG